MSNIYHSSLKVRSRLSKDLDDLRSLYTPVSFPSDFGTVTRFTVVPQVSRDGPGVSGEVSGGVELDDTVEGGPVRGLYEVIGSSTFR